MKDVLPQNTKRSILVCVVSEMTSCGSCSTAGMNVKQSATHGVLGGSKARATTYKRGKEASDYACRRRLSDVMLLSFDTSYRRIGTLISCLDGSRNSDS